MAPKTTRTGLAARTGSPSAARMHGARSAAGRGTLARPGIVLQPIIQLSSGRLWGYEALARVPGSPARLLGEGATALPPEIANELEARMLRSALSVLPDLPARSTLCVNVSPAALVSAPVAEVLEERSLDGIVVELTEYRPVEPLYEDLADAGERLRALGARFALDDVGAGRAGLRHLRRLRPDLVKMEASVLRGFNGTASHALVARSIASVTAEAGATLVVEGVEGRTELDAALELGAELGQGYVLGPPRSGPSAPPSAVTRYLRARRLRSANPA